MPIFKLLFGLKWTSSSLYYVYSKTQHDQLLFNRLTELYSKGTRASKIYVFEKQKLGGWIGHLQSLFPFNQSLIITDPKTGIERHVGMELLQKNSSGTPPPTNICGGVLPWNWFGTWGWTKYTPDESNNMTGRRIPIEAWTSYYVKYGQWPDAEKINRVLLNQLTRTADEIDTSRGQVPLFTMELGQKFTGWDGSSVLGLPKNALLNVIKAEERQR